MLNDINLLIGISGLLVGILGVAHSFIQLRKITTIKNRNRAYSWGLAKDIHRLMAKLEQIYSAIQKGDLSIEGKDAEKYKALFSRGYESSANLVSKTGEHLVVEYNVTEEELSNMEEDKIAWGHLESSIQLALKSIKDK